MTASKLLFFPVYIFAMTLLAPAVWAASVDSQRITVSGLSSGAYMAEQMAVAYSDVFTGLGVFAGGAYDCAQGELGQALGGCSNADFTPPALTDLLTQTRDLERQGLIAPTTFLQRNKFYFYHGKKDPIISLAAAKQSLSFFRHFGVPDSQMLFVDTVEGGHGLPTLNFGNPCATGDESPFLNNCGYDGAGEMLNQLYGKLNPKTTAVKQNLFQISQKFPQQKNPELISMGPKAYVYVPTACQQGQTCRLHVAFHGCRQTTDDIQNQFFTKAGYNEWAESNDIIVLYPQAVRSPFLNNPKGCWDWWGYTGAAYETRNGPQLQAVMSLIKEISSESFPRTRHSD
jgi:poly(3-hydroxybutyrate) depolymerase